MDKTKIIQTISIPKRKIIGIAIVNKKIQVANFDKNRVYHGELDASDKYRTIEDVKSQIVIPTGLTWDGEKLYIADRVEKKIYSTDLHMRKFELVLSLMKFKPDKIPLVFLSQDSEIGDISWGKGLLWFTCVAGYSSSFYGVDITNKKVVHHFKARGPEPEGISFDSQEKSLWVLDASNRELSQFKPDGEWTGKKLQIPLEKPIGLSIDDNNRFWIIDLKSMKLYSLEEEEF